MSKNLAGNFAGFTSYTCQVAKSLSRKAIADDLSTTSVPAVLKN